MAIKTALIKTEPRCLAYDCDGLSLGREGRGPDNRQSVKLAGSPWRRSCKASVL